MLVASTIIQRPLTYVCRKKHVLLGIISINPLHETDAILHLFRRQLFHYSKLFPKNQCTSLLGINHQQKRYIDRGEVNQQVFFPQYEKDNVPREYEMIYQSKYGSSQLKSMFWVGLFAVVYLGCTVNFIFKVCGVFEEDDEDQIVEVPLLGMNLPALVVAFNVLLAAMFLMHFVAVYRFSRLTVPRMYLSANKTKYIGIFRSQPWSTERIEFTLSDVESIPKPKTIFLNGNCSVKGKKCILYSADFSSKSHFNKLLGFDIKLDST
ncbi:hypothetical protein ACF0H5_006982 [Mactra antiquata]